MAKPKGKLDFLTDQQFEALKGWLWGGMTNQKAVEQLFVEFGIKTSTRAVGEFGPSTSSRRSWSSGVVLRVWRRRCARKRCRARRTSTRRPWTG